MNAFNPWDRITDVVSVRKLLQDGGVKDAEIIPEDGVRRSVQRMTGGPSHLVLDCVGQSSKWVRKRQRE